MTLMTFQPAPRTLVSSSWLILPLPRTGPSKRWSYYAEAARLLAERGLDVWVIGGPGEKTLAEEIVAAGGPNVRVDSFAYAGCVIPPFYDSLVATVVVHGTTRADAIARMDVALRETKIEGVRTTVDICRKVIADERFQAGGFGIDFLPTFLTESR